MIITKLVKDQLLAVHAEVFFVSRAATKWWNAHQRDKRYELALLGGYYWSCNGIEAGPFRSISAAWRDAYYRGVLAATPPGVRAAELAALALRNPPAPGPRKGRRKRPATKRLAVPQGRRDPAQRVSA